jgi:hypothetical protein
MLGYTHRRRRANDPLRQSPSGRYLAGICSPCGAPSMGHIIHSLAGHPSAERIIHTRAGAPSLRSELAPNEVRGQALGAQLERVRGTPSNTPRQEGAWAHHPQWLCTYGIYQKHRAVQTRHGCRRRVGRPYRVRWSATGKVPRGMISPCTPPSRPKSGAGPIAGILGLKVARVWTRDALAQTPDYARRATGILCGAGCRDGAHVKASVADVAMSS